MTPEQELLLRCTEPPGHDGIAGLVALLDRERIDWSAFVQFAALQGLGPVVYRRLRTCCPDRIPVKEMERLRVLHFANSARTLFHTRVLGAILYRMESCGVRAIPFKGPVLAAQIYGDANLRVSNDIDILVRRRDARAATEALAPLGFRPECGLGGAQGAALLCFYCELGLSRPDDGTLVEIQWALVPWHYGFKWDFPDAFDRASTVKADGAVFPALPPEELLLALCIHGTKHRWERLLWVCDVAWLVSSEKDLDWDRALSIASAAGGLGALFLGLRLARDFFRVDLPDGVRSRVRTGPGLDRLVGEVRRHLFEEGAMPSTLPVKMLFFLRARERRRDRIAFAVKTLLNAFLVVRRPVEMPRSLMPLYFMTRPLSLAAKHGIPILARHAGRSTA